jgi:hypothetical protein
VKWDYAIFMLDLEGRISTWNSGAERTKHGFTRFVPEHTHQKTNRILFGHHSILKARS